MIAIFADTHRKIARSIHRDIYNIYNIELDEKKLVWGSVSPDFYPKYKFIRHYAEESQDFIIAEISKLIFFCRFIDIQRIGFNDITIQYFSRKLGLISHYLSDYMCRPHYERWTFNESLIKHVTYEQQLNEVAQDFEFRKIDLARIDLEQDVEGSIRVKQIVRDYLDQVLVDYGTGSGYEHDLDFAYNLNLRMTFFILDTVKLFAMEKVMQAAFVF
ncbi:MAG: zinc dependent phospholipase C family protein [Tissierellia bacterium]|nr:zinc dependent phospholipase C family protein [Tissierellia bacterium]